MSRYVLIAGLLILAVWFVAGCEPTEPMQTESDSTEQVAQATPKPAPKKKAALVKRQDGRSKGIIAELEPKRDAGALPVVSEESVMRIHLEEDEVGGFAVNAFPPVMPDTEWHRAGWMLNDCLRCHETGVGVAPVVLHQGLPEILKASKCRTCHVIATGTEPTGDKDNAVDSRFNANAFPPMMPNSESHLDAWTIKDCLLCHEDGANDAPVVQHQDLPRLYLKVKCRTCHVQARSIEADPELE